MAQANHRILYHRKWDAGSAKYHEYWTLWRYRPQGGIFLKAKWVRIKEWNGEYSSHVVYHTKAQAEASAKHYGIKIESAANND